MKEANGNVVLLNTPSPALRASSPAGGEGNNACFLPPWRGKVGGARMRGNSTGFTLIELLVVVLIIGILAAVAVPQYQKAVDRSRAVQAVQLVDSLKKATQIWMLEHPGETGYLIAEDSAQELDIDLPCEYDEDGLCQVGIDTLSVDVVLGGSFVNVYSNHHYQNNSQVVIAAVYEDGVWTNKCGYSNDDKRGKAICEGLQGYEAIEDFEV